jgi:hypothetical protein
MRSHGLWSSVLLSPYALLAYLPPTYSLGVPDEASWPLALEPDVVTPAAYRSVITCRVHRTVEVCGTP